MQAVAEHYVPITFVNTDGLPDEDCQAYRRKGIGGSDAAAILGISPFRTARDIYYDKLNIAPVEPDEGNWVALKMGHLLEDLVAEIFTRKTGLPVFQVKRMFQHPLHPFMLADVDYFVTMPDGTTAILEIKTTNYHARKHWWDEDREIVPAYYEAQGRHYMAVMNLNEVFYCCLYGNNEEEVIIRHIERDMTYESELIFLEECFWKENVLAKVAPDYTEDGDLIQASLKRYTGPAVKNGEAIRLSERSQHCMEEYLQLQARKSELDKSARELEAEMKRLRSLITAEMGTNCAAYCEVGGSGYQITYNPVHKREVKKDNLLLLQTLYPEAYRRCVTSSEYRQFRIRAEKMEAA